MLAVVKIRDKRVKPLVESKIHKYKNQSTTMQ